MVIRVTIIWMLAIVFWGCINTGDSSEKDFGEPNFPQQPVEVIFSKIFQIDTASGFQVLKIQDPVSKNYHEYTLVPKGMEVNDASSVIYTPVDDLSLFSVSFIGFLDELEAIDRIKYVENIQYVYNDEVRKKYEKEEVLESGLLGQLNIEGLILDEPELILLNDFQENNEQLSKLMKSGIAVLPIIEWREQHPLARAEWIKVFGALLDKEEEATLIFDQIVADYNEVKLSCDKGSGKTKVLFSSMYEGVWYMPGGRSYVANLLSDANGTYAWSDDKNVGSLSVSFEEVILKSSDNDVWINPDANSFQELYLRDGRYQELVGRLTHGAYQASARVSANGGNDYWESGVVRPDLILRDYGKMLYPQSFEEVDFYYFKKLN